MRRVLPFFYAAAAMMLLLFVAPAHAQKNYTIGSGTEVNTSTGYPCPLQDYYEGSHAQYLYRASELNAAGMIGPGAINSLAFYITNLDLFSGSIEQLTIRIGGTTVTAISTSTWEPTPATVYGPFDYVPTQGFNVFTFSTPFVWNGTDNILVDICNGDPNNGATGVNTYSRNPFVQQTSGLSFNATHTYRADGIGYGCSSTTTTNTGTATVRPNATFYFTSNTACTVPPTPGAAVSSAANVCSGEVFQLSLTGESLGAGQTYQWQSSPDDATWTNMPNDTLSAVSHSQTSSMYYRAMVTCGGNAAPSTSVQVLSPALVSGTFTINSVLPTGAGNFASFGDAINFIKCGISGPVVFNVEPGTAYSEQVNFPAIYGASATNTITINGNGATLSFNASATDNRTGIFLNGTDHLTIDSLNINGTAGTYGWAILLSNAADSNTISRCTITLPTTSTSTNYIGILINGSNNSTNTSGNTGNYNNFIGNTIIGGYYGIQMYGQSTNSCKGNKSINNTITDAYTYANYVYGQESAVISGNHITRPTRTASGTVSACYVSSSYGTLVEKNRVHNLFGNHSGNTTSAYMFYITGADGTSALPNKVINNLVYDIGGNGTVYGLYNLGSDSTLYYHNTIVFDYPTTSTGITYGIYQTTAATGVVYKNNIIYITRGGTGVKRCIYLNTTTSTVVSNNNVYYLAAPAGTDNKVGQYGTTSYETLTDWKNANSNAFDQSSFFVDPQFLNVNPEEYKPSDPSINNIGENLGVATDIYGVARSANPDPGAVEFTIDGCTNPPTAGLAITTDAKPCNGGTFTLNLDGNSTGSGQTYQWQWSTDDATWSNVGDLQTTPLFSTSHTAAHYYRAEVKCSGGTAVYSQSVFVDVVTISGNYTINNLAPTSGTNFASFTDAVNFLKCGIVAPVVFTVEPFSGPYNEKVEIGSIKGTSATNTITFMGNGATLAYAATGSSDRVTLLLNGADHIIIDSLVIDATGGTTYGWGVVLTNQADSNIIRKCNILTSTSSSTQANTIGLTINGSASSYHTSGNNGSYNLIENNTVVGGYYGIDLYGSTSTYNKGNMAVGNKVMDQYAYGFYIYGNKQTTISKNEVTRPSRANTTTMYGVYVSSSDSLLIEKNRLHNFFDAISASSSSCYGIYTTSSVGTAANPNRIENNLIYGQDNNSTLYGIYVNTPYWNVYHNTIIFDNAAATTSSSTYGIYVNDNNINVKNNIVTITRGGTGTKACLFIGSSYTSASNHNDWWMAATGGSNNFVAYKSSGYATLDAWKLSNGSIYDQNSVSVDPMLQQLTPGDFIPSEPIVNNIGEDVGVMTDILGVARTAAPDPGAFEFNLPSCTNPPTAGVITPVATVCLNTNFVLEVTGYSTGEGIRFQWQVSTDNANWTNIDTPMIANTLSISQAVSSYYKVLVTCNGGTAAEATPIFVSSPGLAPAGTYTINSALPTGSGNFQSFGDAVNFIACGIAGPVTFNVAASSGPYNEQVSIPAVNGSSATNTVTWNGNGNTLIYDVNDAGNRGILKLDGADHMIFDSLTIDASLGTYGWGIFMTNSADSNIIRNCTILNNMTATTANYAGIIMSGSPSSPATQGNTGDGNLFEKNMITGGYYGIYMYGSTTDTMHSNRVIDNVIKDHYSVGIYTSYSKNITISGNDISRPTRTNAGTDNIWLSTSYGGLLVEKNRVHNVQDNVTSSSTVYGFDISGASGTAANPNRFENNILYNVKNGNSTVYSIYASGASYWTIAHNTVLIDDATSTSGTTYGIYASGSSGAYVYNNIVSISRGGTGDKYCLYMSSTTIAGSDNNVLYMASTGGTTNAIGYLSSARISLANWQATGFDANSVSVDPMFIDPMNGDLRPAQSSIYYLGKANVGVMTDIVEVTRRVTDPTPGAFEMSGSLPVTVLSIDAIRSGADVKVNWATLTEINNKGFDIERSTDGRSFHKVGFVGTKANAGNSNAKLDYQFLDLAAPTSELYYRLKQYDNNGRSQNSNVVRLKGLGNRRFEITNLFPNPSHKSDLTLLMSSQETSKVTLVVTDVAGKILMQQAETLTQGINTLQVKVTNLPAGNYFIRAICNDGCETTVKKFVIQ